jgi:hypothetical protein
LNLPAKFIGGDGHRHHARRSAIVPRPFGATGAPYLYSDLYSGKKAVKNLKKVALTYHAGGTSLAEL